MHLTDKFNPINSNLIHYMSRSKDELFVTIYTCIVTVVVWWKGG